MSKAQQWVSGPPRYELWGRDHGSDALRQGTRTILKEGGMWVLRDKGQVVGKYEYLQDAQTAVPGAAAKEPVEQS
jgi:hypothetical protein